MLEPRRLPMLRGVSERELIDELRAFSDQFFDSEQTFGRNLEHSVFKLAIALGIRKLNAITDATEISKTIGIPPPIGFVLNPFSESASRNLQILIRSFPSKVQAVPWVHHGYRFNTEFANQDERAEFIKRLTERDLLAPGSIYIKDTAHMLAPALLLARGDFNKVLDMCAAPGGKTLQLAILMNNGGELWANDPSGARSSRLRQTISTFKVAARVTTHPGSWFGQNKSGYFDAVLCDLPCSGSGNMRRAPFVLIQDGEEQLQSRARLQKQLLFAAIEAAKPDGGRIVFSTCSVYPEENESLVHWALEKFRGRIRIVDPRQEIILDNNSVWNLSGAIKDSEDVQRKRLRLSNDQVFPMIRIWPDRYISDAGCCVLFERYR